jgi:prephenate dehydrogenase
MTNQGPELEGRGSILVVGASGKIGQVLAAKLDEEGYEVVGLDIEPFPGHALKHFIQADIETPASLEVLASFNFDILILTIPNAVSEAAVRNIAIPYGRNSLVVDFLSEKHSFAQLMQREVPDSESVGIHPLFAPSAGWKDQNVLVNPRDITSPKAVTLIRQLEAWGAIVHYCDAREHDQLMSFVQVAVHAVLIAYAGFLVAGNVNFSLLDRVSTPASRIIWAMLARILGNDPAVYWEIQANNATAKDTRGALIRSVQSLNEIIQNDCRASFDETFQKLRDLFGENLEKYRRLSEEQFSHLISKH